MHNKATRVDQNPFQIIFLNSDVRVYLWNFNAKHVMLTIVAAKWYVFVRKAHYVFCLLHWNVSEGNPTYTRYSRAKTPR